MINKIISYISLLTILTVICCSDSYAQSRYWSIRTSSWTTIAHATITIVGFVNIKGSSSGITEISFDPYGGVSFSTITSDNLQITPSTTSKTVTVNAILINKGYWTAAGVTDLFSAISFQSVASTNVWVLGMQQNTGNLYTYNWTGSAYQTRGYQTQGGVWTDVSDTDVKTNFKDITVLDKIAGIEIKEYEMKKDKNSIETTGEKHISPTAQDFKIVYGIGDGIGLSAKDVSGVALQGIKELNQKIIDLEKRIEKIENK